LRWDVRESDALSESQRTRLVERLDNRLTQRGILVVNASRMRSRVRNRELARQRLAELLDEALAVPRSRTPTRATRASKVRHQAAKQQRAQLKRRRARVSVDDE
jgi:ribosome-associated protein